MSSMLKFVYYAAVALGLWVVLWPPTVSMAACPNWPTADRFMFKGAEISDNLTRLTWKRCSEGQIWDGSASTCSGSPIAFTYEDALIHAQGFNTNMSSNGWRLPTIKELATLADRDCQSPLIDATAFPSTQSGPYWSTSPDTIVPAAFYVVDFSNGVVGRILQHIPLAIRLVRSN